MMPGIRAESRLLFGTRCRAVVVVVVPKGRLFRSRVLLGIDYRGVSLRRPYSEFFLGGIRRCAIIRLGAVAVAVAAKIPERDRTKTPPLGGTTTLYFATKIRQRGLCCDEPDKTVVP